MRYHHDASALSTTRACSSQMPEHLACEELFIRIIPHGFVNSSHHSLGFIPARDVLRDARADVGARGFMDKVLGDYTRRVCQDTVIVEKRTGFSRRRAGT